MTTQIDFTAIPTQSDQRAVVTRVSSVRVSDAIIDGVSDAVIDAAKTNLAALNDLPFTGTRLHLDSVHAPTWSLPALKQYLAVRSAGAAHGLGDLYGPHKHIQVVAMLALAYAGQDRAAVARLIGTDSLRWTHVFDERAAARSVAVMKACFGDDLALPQP